MTTAAIESTISATTGLPALDSTYSLSSSQIAAYQRDGHIQLKGVLSRQETAAYRGPIVETAKQLNKETRPLHERTTYGKAFLQTGNLWTADERVKRFVLAKRFGHIAAQLMGVSGVRIYHDQALFKEAGGGFTPWHQDQYYWPLDGVQTTTMWLPLVDVPVDMGALSFASGSHKTGFLGHVKISDESEAHYDQFVRDQGFPFVCDPFQAGDATFHNGWTLHKAPGNNGTYTREVMTVIYYADGGKMSVPDNPNRENDLRWLGGKKPGEIANSALNPKVG